jgi:predicted AAA+ superfamily ATPase
MFTASLRRTRNGSATSWPATQLFHWRTRGGSEVDLVCYGTEGIIGIEVKNSARVQPADLRGLAAFGEDYPEARRVLIYRGRERLRQAGTLCLPATDFLRSLDPRRALQLE